MQLRQEGNFLDSCVGLSDVGLGWVRTGLDCKSDGLGTWVGFYKVYQRLFLRPNVAIQIYCYRYYYCYYY